MYLQSTWTSVLFKACICHSLTNCLGFHSALPVYQMQPELMQLQVVEVAVEGIYINLILHILLKFVEADAVISHCFPLFFPKKLLYMCLSLKFV